MKVLIVGSSKLPIPAELGGAVPNLIEELLSYNESSEKIDFDCISIFNDGAIKKSQEFKKTKFLWVKTPWLFRTIDKLIYFVFHKIFKKKRTMSIAYLGRISWFTIFTSRILRKNNYDYVIFENSVPVMASLKFWNNQKKYKGKYFLHIHTVPKHWFRTEKIIRESNKIICVSNYVKEQIEKDVKLKAHKNNLIVMYNCLDYSKIDTNKIKKDYIKEKLGIKNNEKIILFTGRLCSEKGVIELINAIKLLKNENIKLVIVGSNFYKTTIKSSFEKQLINLSKPISDKVVFTGYINYKDIFSYYSAADVVVLPSMWDEPAGMTMLETMACKKPLITTKSGGIPEYVGEGNCIMLDRTEHIVDELAISIKNVIDNDNLGRDLGDKAYRHASRFNEKYFYQQLIDILNKRK